MTDDQKEAMQDAFANEGTSGATKGTSGGSKNQDEKEEASIDDAISSIEQATSSPESGTGKTYASGNAANVQQEMANNIEQASNLLDADQTRLETSLNSISQGALTPLLKATSALNSGLSTFNATAPYLVSSINQLSTGAQKISASNSQLLSGSNQLYGGLSSLQSQIPALTSGIQQLLDGNQQLTDNSASLVDGSTQISDGLTTLNSQVPTLTSGVSKLYQGSSQVSTGLGTMNDQMPALTSGVSQLAGGAQQLSSGLVVLNGQVPTLVSGVTQLTSGSGQLYGGLSLLNGKTGALMSGVNQLSDGAGKLDANSSKLTSGTSKLVAGDKKLVSGLSAGAKKVNATPLTSKTAKMFAAPTSLKHDNYSYVPNFGYAIAPFIVALISLLGTSVIVATFAWLNKLRDRRSILELLGLVGAQAIVMTGILNLILTQIDHPLEFMMFSTLAALLTAIVETIFYQWIGKWIFILIGAIAGLDICLSNDIYPTQTIGRLNDTIGQYFPMHFLNLVLRQTFTSGIDINLPSLLIILFCVTVFGGMILTFMMKPLTPNTIED